MPRFVKADSDEGKAYIHALQKRFEKELVPAPVPAARGGQKAAALQKKTASEMPSSFRAVSPVLGELKLTAAAAKSYICARTTSSDKWTHVCSVYKTQTPDHSVVARRILKQLSGQPLDKADACKLRDSLVAAADLEELADSDGEDDNGQLWA